MCVNVSVQIIHNAIMENRKNYPDYKKEFKDFFSGPFGSAKTKMLEDEFGEENLKIYKKIKQFGEWKGVQTRLPFLLEIR